METHFPDKKRELHARFIENKTTEIRVRDFVPLGVYGSLKMEERAKFKEEAKKHGWNEWQEVATHIARSGQNDDMKLASGTADREGAEIECNSTPTENVKSYPDDTTTRFTEPGGLKHPETPATMKLHRNKRKLDSLHSKSQRITSAASPNYQSTEEPNDVRDSGESPNLECNYGTTHTKR